MDVRALTVVVALDSFKGTATAAEAVTAVAQGWLDGRPGDRVLRIPLADGGEGTLDAFAAAHPGASARRVDVIGPDSTPRTAQWLYIPGGDSGGTGVVELAATSGITLLDRPLPMDAHTTGFGQAIADALATGVDRLVLALGGSASTDGGLGALVALGARATDGRGRAVRPGGRGLADLAALDLSDLPSPPAGGVTILADVTHPLVGPDGAAAVFGPQKGASPDEVVLLDAGLARLVDVAAATRPDARQAAVTPGAGAAGGTAFGLLLWGAEIRSGAAEVTSLLGVHAAIGAADVVITGEGRYDSQSSRGKLPAHVLASARAAGATTVLVAGAITDHGHGATTAVALTDLAGGPAAAMADARSWLREAGRRAAVTVAG